MGELEQAIEMAIEKVSGKKVVKQIFTGIAKEIGDLTCTVEREGSPALFDVRLNAIDDELESYLTIYPAEGSAVLVAIIENMKTEAVVIRCSEVEKVKAKVGTTVLELDATGLRFGRSDENLQKVLEDLIAEIQKIVVVIGTSPNVAALEVIKNRMKTILR